jgi:K+-sensing histidine kinase KdpD
MDPIIVKTRLEFKRYRNVNLHILLKRKILWFMLALAFIMLFLSFVIGEGNTLLYLAVFYFVYLLAMPLLVIMRSKSYYKKIAHMSEPKTYEFSDTGIKVSGETIKLETHWSNINKAVKQKEHYILFSSNSRNFFTFPQSDFAREQDIAAFEQLVKQNVKTNNF